MSKTFKCIIVTWLVIFGHSEICGQQFIKIDTTDVDLLAVFYYSGDKDAFEDNYFGMVMLENAYGIDTLLPSSICSYHYCPTEDTINNTIKSIINDHFIANVTPGEYMQHCTFFRELTQKVWKDSMNTWKDSVTFLMAQAFLHKDNNYSFSNAFCFTAPFWEDSFHCDAPPTKHVDLIGGGHPIVDADFRQAGYYYQLHKIRMAFLIIEDDNDTILKLSYFNRISPVLPQSNYKRSTAEEQVKFMMGNACATHLQAFDKDGVSRVAAPYLYETIPAENHEQSKEN